MSDRLRKVQRIYDKHPDAYHRAMSTRFSDWMLGGRRRKVGETVRGLVLDVGFGTGLSSPEPGDGGAAADHMNRRTPDIIKRSGVEVLSIERWFAGVFNLTVGRALAG